jgi:hypothetical protein
MRYITSINNRRHFSRAVVVTEAIMGTVYLATVRGCLGGGGGGRQRRQEGGSHAAAAELAGARADRRGPAPPRPPRPLPQGVVGYAALGSTMDVHKCAGAWEGLTTA